MAEHFLYESNALKQTHPRHLFALANALGVKATPPDKCRVLEIACASGGNLMPMAYHLPQSQFVGIDISEQEIALANKVRQALALSNIEFIAQDIRHFNPTGTFDYIICHGLYSWVEQSVRENILTLCQKALSENGIAYISYNTYPAWAIGNTLRSLLLSATQSHTSIQDKLTATHALLNELLITLKDDSAYEWLLKEEVKLVLKHSDSQLLHEHLGTWHYPLHFSEFLAQTQTVGLHYLCDATFFEFEQERFNAAFSQKRDLIENRRFRSSLLTKTPPTKNAVLSDLKSAYAALSVVPDAPTFISHAPTACAFARFQATRQEHVTNRLHENILLTPLAQALLPYLDGQHNAQQLIDIILHYINAGELIMLDNQGAQIRDLNELTKKVTKLYDETILLLAQRHLLVD